METQWKIEWKLLSSHPLVQIQQHDLTRTYYDQMHSDGLHLYIAIELDDQNLEDKDREDLVLYPFPNGDLAKQIIYMLALNDICLFLSLIYKI